MWEIIIFIAMAALILYSFTDKCQHAGKGDGKSSGGSSSSSTPTPPSDKSE